MIVECSIHACTTLSGTPTATAWLAKEWRSAYQVTFWSPNISSPIRCTVSAGRPRSQGFFAAICLSSFYTRQEVIDDRLNDVHVSGEEIPLVFAYEGGHRRARPRRYWDCRAGYTALVEGYEKQYEVNVVVQALPMDEQAKAEAEETAKAKRRGAAALLSLTQRYGVVYPFSGDKEAMRERYATLPDSDPWNPDEGSPCARAEGAMTEKEVNDQFTAKVRRGIFRPIMRHLSDATIAEDRLQDAVASTWLHFRKHALRGEVLPDGILVFFCRMRATDLRRHFVPVDGQRDRDVLEPRNYHRGRVQVLRLDGICDDQSADGDRELQAFYSERRAANPSRKLRSAHDLEEQGPLPGAAMVLRLPVSTG